MRPSPAEVARTLAAGRVPGVVRMAFRPGRYAVRHATDADGAPLLLDRADGRLAGALRPLDDGADATAVVLEVEDAPPLPGGPSLGRVSVSGWARPLTGVPARAGAIEFAAVRAVGDLLDVGRGAVLYRVDVDRVRLERAGESVDVDAAEYAAAASDPLHEIEREVLVDLADHHGPQIVAFLRRRLAESGYEPPPGARTRMVRLDRYGFVIDVDDGGAGYRARLAFPRAVANLRDLARLLHPVLCGRCHCA